MATDPIDRFNKWFRKAQRAGIPQPEAFALATANSANRLSVRFVLLKNCDRRGLVFYTNAMSRKGRELRRNPRAGVAFFWARIGRQVCLEGQVSEVSQREADDYWASRPRQSQLASMASRQSEPLKSRAVLVRRMRALARRFKGKPVPRPSNWTGFRIKPHKIEFWTVKAHRLNKRELFERTPRGWKIQLLQP